jgi:hypothetical protein
MAITQRHVSFLWGAFEVDAAEAQTPAYLAATDYATLGADAAAGTAVRRATLVIDRTAATPSDDDMTMHFDFVNITGGAADDTWITADFTTLEARLSTWFLAVKPYVPTYARFSRVLWHRVGPGIAKPNPAVRILDIASPQSGTSGPTLPPQCASSITLRTGLRRHWGRTYLPFTAPLTTDTRVSSAQRVAITGATVALLNGAYSDDFHPVVVSTTRNRAFGVEAVEVDDVVDIVRRRRFKHVVSKTITTL